MTDLNSPHNSHGEEASMSMKALLLIFAVVVIGALGYLVWNQNNSTTDESDSVNIYKKVTPTAVIDSTATATATADQLTYTNTDYGFSIALTSVWKGWSTIVKTSNFPDTPPPVVTVYFALPTSDKSMAFDVVPAGKWSPFSISVYTLKNWQEIQKVKDEFPTPTKLGQDTNYVFAYGTAQDAPVDGQKVNIDEVAANFKLTK